MSDDRPDDEGGSLRDLFGSDGRAQNSRSTRRELLAMAGFLGVCSAPFAVSIGIDYVLPRLEPGIYGRSGPDGPPNYDTIEIDVFSRAPYGVGVTKYYPDSNEQVIAPDRVAGTTIKWTDDDHRLPTAVEVRAEIVGNSHGELSITVSGDGKKLKSKSNTGHGAEVVLGVYTADVGVFQRLL